MKNNFKSNLCSKTFRKNRDHITLTITGDIIKIIQHN